MSEERIAVLEIKVQTLEEQNKTIITKLEGIGEQLSKQKGFVAGMTFVVSALAAVIATAFEYWRH